MKNICVVGTGYVGLVTGACLADLDNNVVCLDIVPEKIARLRAGEMPIYEPGLEPLVRRNVAAARLRFTTSYAEAVGDADYIFIAVNTPTVAGGFGADMSYVEAAARSIAHHLRRDTVIINKSTMPVGSGDLVSNILHEHLSANGVSVAVVSNPEFLREGNAVQDFLRPDRVVLGSTDRVAAERVAQLYLPLRAPIVITDLYTAEMIKYASNAFLATKISFINEIARICDRLGADVKEVAAGMGYDKRIGRAFLDAGVGYGGSCFPKDIKALTHMADSSGLHPQMLDAVMKINEDQRRLPVDKLIAEIGVEEGNLRGRTVAVLGLAFKDNTDDMRDAPSIDVINWLIETGADVRVFDPVATETAKGLFPDWEVTYCVDEYDAARQADAVVLVTEWKRFRDLNLARLRETMRPCADGPIFVDGRNLFDPGELKVAGFRYRGIGRGNGRRNGNGNGGTGGDKPSAAPTATTPAEHASKARANGAARPGGNGSGKAGGRQRRA
ncbi:MAG TPA: UDP-glucose/GDP-mannose dehydrogenase family protein [Ktedonobacterales bacterium]|nr:UDP-glucose/GDP-mannose dehydrogenase family protein [Ktedonobacterales bacterium]